MFPVVLLRGVSVFLHAVMLKLLFSSSRFLVVLPCASARVATGLNRLSFKLSWGRFARLLGRSGKA